MQQLFPARERGRAFGVIGTAVGVATAAGPVVGGTIIALGGPVYGWRLCFLLNVPVGISSFLLCRAWLPARARSGAPRPLDLPGAALLAIGVFGLLFPAVQYDATRDARLALLLLPALVVLGGFVAWERGPARRRGHPLSTSGCSGCRSYAGGVALALLFFCAYTGTPLVLALFLQDGLGYSALHSGLTASAYAVGATVAAPIAGRLLRRLGQRVLVGGLAFFGVGVAAAGAVSFVFSGSVAPAAIGLLLAAPLLVAGLGGGSVITPNQALSLADVDVRGGSTAGGTLQTAQRIGNALGAAVICAVFYAAARGAPPTGPAREAHYGRAYSLALVVSVLFTCRGLAGGDALRPPSGAPRGHGCGGRRGSVSVGCARERSGGPVRRRRRVAAARGVGEVELRAGRGAPGVGRRDGRAAVPAGAGRRPRRGRARHGRLPAGRHPGDRAAAGVRRVRSRPVRLAVEPGAVVACGDVMAGVRLALETLCDRRPSWSRCRPTGRCSTSSG